MNHIERDHDTREADSVRELFDPLGQQGDMPILHIALDTLDYLEDEMIGAGARASQTRQQLSTDWLRQEEAEDAALPDHARSLQVPAEAEGRDCYCAAITDSDRHSMSTVTASAAVAQVLAVTAGDGRPVGEEQLGAAEGEQTLTGRHSAEKRDSCVSVRTTPREPVKGERWIVSPAEM